MIFLYLKLPNFWFCLYYIHVATSVCKLGLWITKSPRYRETAREHPDWADNVLGLSWLYWIAARLWFFLLFRISFDTLCRGSLVDLAPSFDDPLVLLNI